MMLDMRQIAFAAAAAALLLITGCSPTPNPDPAEPVNPPSTSVSPKSPATGAASRVITFGKRGAFIKSADEVSQLKGTSPEFQEFIADLADHLQPPAGSTDCAVGVTVNLYDPTGFARGAINECGGYAALWGRQDGRWKELIGTQDLWSCTDLRKFKVPSTIADTCYTSKKAVPYTG